MLRCMGIDLINTNSRIAVLEDGKPTIIFNGQDGGTPDLSETGYTQRLKKLKSIAEGYLGETVTHVGIAVPYFFNTLQRQTLLQAADNANFMSVRLLSESATAAMTCCGASQPQKILVCSLHGKMFSVSAVEYDDDVLEEVFCADTDRLEDNIKNNLWPAERTIRRVMRAAEWKPEDVYGVLLLRDASRIPEMRNMVVNRLGLKPVRGVSPDDCIAQGAALRAGTLTGELDTKLVLDLLPQPLHAEMPDGTLTDLCAGLPLTIPARLEIDYSWDGGADDEVRLFHGKQTVMRFNLKTVFPVQPEKRPVKLLFDLDSNGILTVFVQDPTDEKKLIPVSCQTVPAAPSSPKIDPLNHTVEIIRALLPVYDNLERAMRQDTTDTAYKKGVEMTMNQLKGVLAKLGITEIDALGKPFDPNFHNAVMHIEDGSFGKNVVSQVFQTGFMIGNKVVRFAAVQVAN